jgi:hypothetical protein
MAEAAPTRKRRRLRTVVARTLLVLTLLPQLGVLWVLHRPSPTSLPAGLAAALLEATLDDTTAEVGRVTLDRRGVLRLEGVRLRHPETRRLDGMRVHGPGELLQAELDATLVPAWKDWLLLRPTPPELHAQGRVTSEGGRTAQPLIDRLDLRLGPEKALLVGRAGGFHLRIVGRSLAAGGRGSRQVETAPGTWIAPAQALLAALRGFEGGLELVAEPGALRLEGSGRMREGAVLRDIELGGATFPVGADGFSLRANLGEEGGRAWLRARQLRLGTARTGTMEATASLDGDLRLVAQGLEFAGIREGGVVMTGRLLPTGGAGDWALNSEVAAELGESRLGGTLLLSRGQLELRGGNVAAPARDLVRLPGLGELLREAGVDFAGRVELADAQALARHGGLVGASGRFALTHAGWGDIRPSSIRPERPASALSGAWRIEPGLGIFLLDDLDLAGLRGSIGGGLRKGDPYEIRLHSTEGNPVHPGFLNALLGDWWVGLWKRFDLTTTRTSPHADVHVRGKWGEAEPDRVVVAATLANFGFMGARFASTRVRVDATPTATVARIEELSGLIEGRPAGIARGTLRWDWTAPAAGGRPEILAEGDLEPLCALRLHDPGLAQKLRGWSFGLPWTKVAISPEGVTRVELVTGESSRLAGIEVGPMRLEVVQAAPGSPLDLKADAAFAGGRLEVRLKGNLGDRNQVQRLALVDVWWADLQKALPGVLGPPDLASKGDPASLSADFSGEVDFGQWEQARGAGTFRLRDPRLKTVHLLGGLSQALSLVGIDFSTYPLTEAQGTYRLRDGRAELNPLVLKGDDALMELQGGVSLLDGRLMLDGEFRLRKSPWGILGYINPNRLIAKVLKIKIRGTLSDPKASVEARPF